MITIVSSVSRDSDPVPLARFELVDGKIQATYANDSFQREMEQDGVYVGGVILHPNDGEPFLVALNKYYSRSMTIIVETLPES